MKNLNWYVNVNKNTIRANAVNNTDKPPIRIARGKHGEGTYCSEVELPAGSRVIYSAASPILKCGARLVIECPTEPKVIR